MWRCWSARTATITVPEAFTFTFAVENRDPYQHERRDFHNSGSEGGGDTPGQEQFGVSVQGLIIEELADVLCRELCRTQPEVSNSNNPRAVCSDAQGCKCIIGFLPRMRPTNTYGHDEELLLQFWFSTETCHGSLASAAHEHVCSKFKLRNNAKVSR